MSAAFLIIDLIITVFVFLAFPIVFSATKGKVSMRKAKKYALLNSIICAIIFLVASLLISGGTAALTNLAPPVLYYFIAKAIMGDKNLEEDENSDVDEDIENDTICENCESQLLEDDKTCPDCNAELKHIENEQAEEEKEIVEREIKEEVKSNVTRKSKKYKLRKNR